jgi:hypothetical protein
MTIKQVTIMQVTRKRLKTLALAGAAICLANAAYAYSYTFDNNTNQYPQPTTVTHIWMHTVSDFCHDVSWYGTLTPGNSVTVNSASICLVDRVEINFIQMFSSPVGLTSTTFRYCGDGHICPSFLGAARRKHR